MSRSRQEEKEAEGHVVIQRGRKNIKYYVEDYENVLFELPPYSEVVGK